MKKSELKKIIKEVLQEGMGNIHKFPKGISTPKDIKNFASLVRQYQLSFEINNKTYFTVPDRNYGRDKNVPETYVWARSNNKDEKISLYRIKLVSVEGY